MKHLKYTSWVPLLSILMMSSESLASSWTCQYAELTRHIVIFYPDAPSRLPCKVYYTKPTENFIPHSLWKAENDENYCEQKAVELIKKLESWGWQCSVDNDQ